MKNYLLLLFVLLTFPSIAQENNCLIFDGSGDEIRASSSVGQAIGSGDFTIEAIVRGNEEDTPSHSAIFSNRQTGDSGLFFGFHNYWGGSSHKMLFVRYNAVNYLHIDNGEYDGKILDGECHHVAVVKSGSTLSYYVDGLLIGSNTVNPDYSISTNSELLIGSDDVSNSHFDGTISNVRVWDIGRTQQEIELTMDSTITDSVDGLISNWPLSEGQGQMVSDLAGDYDGQLGASVVEDTDDPSWLAECCQVEQVVVETGDCLVFDGSGDEIRASSNIGQSINSGDFTIEAIVRGNEEDTPSHSAILSNRQTGDSGLFFGFHSYWGGSAHKMLFVRYNALNYVHINNGNYDGKILDGECHHVAVVKSGSTLSYYVDGLFIGSNTVDPDYSISTASELIIGSDEVSNSHFDGTISNVRIWDLGRTQEEIQLTMDSTITESVSGLIGNWPLSEGQGQMVSDLAGDNDGQLGASMLEDADDPAWLAECCEVEQVFIETGECLYFNGSGEEVRASTGASNSIGSGDFTIEAIVRGNEEDTPSHSSIVSNRQTGDSGIIFGFHSYWGGSDHKMLFVRYNGVNYLHINNGDYDGKILDGECHHVAVVKSGDQLQFFVDGTLIGTKTIDPNYNISTNNEFVIGGDDVSGSHFAGAISNVRIWSVSRTQAEIQDNVNEELTTPVAGLEGNWPLKDGIGQVVIDYAQSNDGYLGSLLQGDEDDPSWTFDCCETITVTPPIDDLGDCLIFDGMNDEVITNETIGQTLSTGDFTIEANVTGLEGDVPSHSTIVSNRQSGDSGILFGFHDYWGGSQYKMLFVRYNGVNYVHINNGDFNAPILDGDCHHVAVTKSSDTLSYFVDGTLIGMNTINPNYSLSTSAPMRIGSDLVSNSNFGGNISNVRIWSTARTATELQNSMDFTLPGTLANMVANYPMGENTGQIVTDVTTNNDGQLGAVQSADSNDPKWIAGCCHSSIVISTDELEGADPYGISIAPNPTSNEFQLSLDNPAREDLQVAVFDNLGRLIIKREWTQASSTITINLEDKATGIYLVSILNSENNRIRTLKVVKE